MVAGYSATPLSRKLGIKPAMRLAFDSAPSGWVPDAPDDVVVAAASEPADLIIAFFRYADELPARLPALAERIFPAGAVWIAWPRRAGGHSSDITDNVVREHALPLGIVDVKVAAIDEDWSGLRFVWRTNRRAR
jgi:hypothetical protein